MSQAAPRWTSVGAERPPSRRRRYAPLLLAIALAALVWGVIALGGALLRVWLA